MNVRAHSISIILIIILGFAVYANSLSGEFIWDDLAFVRDNPFIRHISNIPKIFSTEATTGLPVGGGEVRYNLYRPLQWLTFIVDYSLWGPNPFGYHLTNVILHIAVALLIFWLIVLLAKDLLLASLTALLFVVHPVHTEAVSYISGRADSLALVFLLISYIFYIKNVDGKKIFFCAVSLISYALAIFSRESSLVFPALLLLHHYIFLDKKGSGLKAFKSKQFLSFAIVTFAFIVFRFMMIGILLGGKKLPVGLLVERLPGVFVAIASYLRILIAPFHLHMEYGNGVFSFSDPRAIAGAVLFIASLVFAFIKRSNKILLFSILWFYITLLPSLNIYPIGAYMAEHWLYLPSIGFFIMVSVGISRLPGKIFITAATVLLVGFYSVLTVMQNNYWKELTPFYERTLKYAPESARLLTNLGVAYNDQKRYSDALAAFNKAFEIEPNLLEVRYNLGTVYADMGEIDKAIEYFRKEIDINPNYHKAYNNLGAVYSDTGEYGKAIEIYREAIEINPDRVEVRCNLGFAYYNIGKYVEAEAEYKKAIEIAPNYVKAHNDLGIAYHASGGYVKAIESYRNAIKVDSNNALIYLNLAISYEAINNKKDAIEAYKDALGVDPDYAVVHNNLAIAYFIEKDYEKAIEHCDKAIVLGYDIASAFLTDLAEHRK